MFWNAQPLSVITMLTVVAAATRFLKIFAAVEGKAGPGSGPTENVTQDAFHPVEASSRANNFGMKWNETAFWGACKLLKMWWPGTELNRRRQPFQGCALREVR